MDLSNLDPSMAKTIETFPLALPPPGVVANFDNPENIGFRVLVAAGICIPIILTFAAMRMYTKFFIVKKPTYDDAFYIVAVAGAITFIGLIVTLVDMGSYGTHSYNVLVGDLSKEKILVSSVIACIYPPFIWFIKFTLFLLYLQIFNCLRWLRWCAWGGALITGLFYFTAFIILTPVCNPPVGKTGQLDYLGALASEKCKQYFNPISLSVGIINLVSDLYLVILPLPAVWSLHLPTKKKIGVSSMFLIGIIACITSALSLRYRINTMQSTDNTWTVIPLWICMIVEITAGIIVASMPSTAVVYNHVKTPIHSFLSSSKRTFLSSRYTRTSKSTHDSSTDHGSQSSTSNMHTAPHNSYAATEKNASRGATNFTKYPVEKSISDSVTPSTASEVSGEAWLQSPYVEEHTRPEKIYVSERVEVGYSNGQPDPRYQQYANYPSFKY